MNWWYFRFRFRTEDSEQPGHPPSPISLPCPHEESLGPQLPIHRTVKTLIRQGRCPGWSESSSAHVPFCRICHALAHICFSVIFLWWVADLYVDRAYVYNLELQQNEAWGFARIKLFKPSNPPPPSSPHTHIPPPLFFYWPLLNY